MLKKYIEDLKEIRDIMSRASRFISLTGLSGVSTGIIALVGALLSYLISALTILVGVVLLTYMINVESELGALPIVFILVGAVGFMVIQIRFKN